MRCGKTLATGSWQENTRPAPGPRAPPLPAAPPPGDRLIGGDHDPLDAGGVVQRGFNTTTIWMVEQLGLAMMPLFR